MKTSKIIARALVLLGFGGTVGLSTGCGANRAQRSRTPQSESPSVVPDDDNVARVMYGVSPVRFDPDKPIRETAPRAGTVETTVEGAETETGSASGSEAGSVDRQQR